MRIEKFQPISNTPAELLYRIVWASILEKERSIANMRTITDTMEAWVAFIDNKPIAIQVVEPVTEKRVNQIISWTNPSFRGQGIFKKLNAVVDLDLSNRGFTHYISYVIGPEKEMLQAVLNRGGRILEYKCQRPIYTKEELHDRGDL
jgi:hypothetical protein